MSLSKPHRHAEQPRLEAEDLDQHVRDAHVGWTAPSPPPGEKAGWMVQALHDADHMANDGSLAEWAPVVGAPPRPTKETDLMLTTGLKMGQDHGPEHPRHLMWTRLSDLLVQAAPLVGHGNPHPEDARGLAYNLLAVARHYQEAEQKEAVQAAEETLSKATGGGNITVTVDKSVPLGSLSTSGRVVPLIQMPREAQCRYDGLAIVEVRRWTEGGQWEPIGWRHWPGWSCASAVPRPVT